MSIDMKTRFFSFYIIVLLLFSLVFPNYAQVTIGVGEKPEDGALLDAKERTVLYPNPGDVTSLNNSTRGILFPRVMLEARDKLEPLYQSPSDAQKLLVTGMVVYNVSPTAQYLSEGLFVWNGYEWIPLAYHSAGNAEYTILNCNINVAGTYQVDKALKSNENYVTVELSVTKTGVYDFVITTNPDNGYYFNLAGQFLKTGTHSIMVPGAGMPRNPGDNVLRYWIDGIEHIPQPAPCEKRITVIGSKPNFTYNCQDIKVEGEYKPGVTLTNSNKITIKMSASPASDGSKWHIETDPSNGYKFVGEGIIGTDPGWPYVDLFGQGTPESAGINTFKLKHNSADPIYDCPVNVEVKGEQSQFTIECASVSVKGVYVKGKPLVNGNYIDVTLTSPSSQANKPYVIESDTVNGYYFKKEGTLKGGTETIRIPGNGTPITSLDDVFTIKTNSSTQSQNCTFKVILQKRRIRIASVGGFWYNIGGIEPGTDGQNRLIKNPSLFGLGSDSEAKCRVQGFDIVTGEAKSNLHFWMYANTQQMRDMINSQKPDIIIGGYEWQFIEDKNLQQAVMKVMADFVEQGGVFIYSNDMRNIPEDGDHRKPNTQFLLDYLFGDGSNGSSGLSLIGSVTTPNTVPFVSAHPVIKGPYLDLTGKNMQRDGNFNVWVTGSNPNMEVLVQNSPSQARVIVHKTKGFMFIGDGGPFTYSKGNNSVDSWPMKLSVSGGYYWPQSGPGNSQNAYFFLNTMAWAIDKALENRPNGEDYHIP